MKTPLRSSPHAAASSSAGGKHAGPRLRLVQADEAELEPPRGSELPSPPTPERLARAIEYFLPLKRYHRLRVSGLDRIPEGPALLVGNHNGGLNPVDGLFLVEYYRARGYTDPIYILAHDLVFRVPAIARVATSLGLVRAEPKMAGRLLAAGRKVLVFPGGDAETLRSFAQRKRIVFNGRRGFVRLAQRCQVPIVPIVGAGGHETMCIAVSGRRLARGFGLARLRVNAMPIMFALPWGVLAGPGLALPYFPLPSRVEVQVCPAIDPADFDGRDQADRLVYDYVEETMQNMLSHLYRDRRVPFWG